MAVPVFMVITGYVACLSFERKGLSLSSNYRPIEIITKWLRFIIPFIPAWSLVVITRIVGRNESFSFTRVLIDFITGGLGYGFYYFPVMLQVVLIIPIIWRVIKHNPLKGVIICFVINVAFEAFKSLIHLSPELYRICSLRYTFILGYGSFLFFQKRERQQLKWYITVGIIGAIYIFLFNYTGLKPIITDQWTVTSVFAVMFIVPLMMILIEKTEIHNRLLETLGKASFNIFLVQMVFYFVGAKLVYKYIPLIPLRLLVIIIVCCTVGIVYYRIESPITKRIIRAIRG